MDGLEVLATYHRWLTASYADKSVSTYYAATVRFLTATGKSLRDVTEDDAARWLETFPYRSPARRTYYQGLGVFFAWAVRNGHIATSPLVGIPVPRMTIKAKRALSAEQLIAVFAAAGSRSPVREAALRFLYYSGCRLDEMRHVTWADMRPDGVLLRKTKGGHERVIPWSPGLRQAVETLRSFFGEGEVMIPRSHQTVWLWAKTAGTDAGVENVHPHLFRSTAATTMLKNGARLHAVRTVLGHANIKTTNGYLADDAEDRERAVLVL